MDKYTILCTELRSLSQDLNGNKDSLQKEADKLQKAINKVIRGDYKASDISPVYTAKTALDGSITRLGQICGAMKTAAQQFSEASAELSGRANLTAYFLQNPDTLSYEGLMGAYSAAITATGGAAAGYELIKTSLEENGYATGSLGSVSNAVQDAIRLEAEAEQARRAEEAKWAKLALTGLVIVGGAVVSIATGGAAAPVVIGAISGAVMGGGNTAIEQYVEHGWDMDSWDYAEIGKDAFVGGITGATTAWIGGGLARGVTDYVSATQLGSVLLNSVNPFVRIGTGAVIGSVSDVISGIGSRGAGAFINTMVETGGDFGESLSEAVDYAFDGKEIAQDAVIGGVQGGKQQYKEWKTDRKAAPIDIGESSAEADTTDWANTSSTADEQKILREMEANGEMTVRPSELPHGSVDKNVPRISEDPIEIDMVSKSPNIDVDEFYSLGYMQEDALNNMTVEEYLEHYDNYDQNGRGGGAAQQEYRYIATESTAYDLMEENPGLSYQEAREQAADMFHNSDALHNPDQNAGGDPTQIHALGGKHENRSLGGLWGSGRADQLHDRIMEMIEGMTPEERQRTRLHVKLNLGKS